MVFIHLFCRLLTTTWPVDDQFMHKLTFHPILSLYHYMTGFERPIVLVFTSLYRLGLFRGWGYDKRLGRR